jgi:hypothetical protein
VSLRFRLTYHSTSDLLADIAQQVSRRGLLIRVPIPAAERGAPVIVEIATPVGDLEVTASVLQLLPGVGVAVELDPAAFEPLAEAARANPVVGEPVQHERIERAASAPAVDDAPEPEAPPDPHERAREASRDAAAQAHQNAQRIQIALHGDKNQRMAILRDQNRQLHGYVLRNPGVQLDEIVFFAKQPTVTPDLLQQIAARREWAERPEVAIAIVRNPKTPVPLAIRMLDHVSDAELRNLARLPSVREPIQRAARKKLLG